MNFAIASCIIAALVCGSAVFLALRWFAWLDKTKGPKGLLDGRVEALEGRLQSLESKVSQQAVASGFTKRL